jgi:hypothetical protein
MRDLVDILRSVTLVVKFAPFLITMGYILSMLLYIFDCERLCAFVDVIFYQSALSSVILLFLSYALRMCVYHHAQCALTLLPTIVTLIDDYIFTLSVPGVLVTLCLLSLLFVCTLWNGYNIFFYDDGERNNQTLPNRDS